MSVHAPLPPAEKRYEQDYQRWIEHQTVLLRANRIDELDLVNLAEELEDMGKRQKRALKSTLTVLLQHLLKYQYQPQRRSPSWHATLVEHRQRLRDDFIDSPSLKPYADEILADCYQDARERAAAETTLPIGTFPPTCRYTWSQILDTGFLPE